jgi:copper chaperone
MHRFAVTGMTCSHCVQSVSRAITRLDAAATVRVDLAAGQVEIASALDAARLAAAIAEEGYGVERLAA